MTDIGELSPTASENKILFPAGILKVKELDDRLRELEALLRRFMNGIPWLPIGRLTGPARVTVVSGTSLSFPAGDLRSIYSIGRMIRATGSETGQIIGEITNSQFTNGGNMVLTVKWRGSGVLRVEQGILLEVYAIGPEYVPNTSLGAGGELKLTENGSILFRVDGQGLQLFVGGTSADASRKPAFTFRPDAFLVGTESLGNRAVGVKLHRTDGITVVSSTSEPLTVCRETANASTAAARFITVVQNGQQLDGGLNSTGNGNILWFNGSPT